MAKRDKRVDWGLTFLLIPSQIIRHIYYKYFLNRLSRESQLLPLRSPGRSFNVDSLLVAKLPMRIFAIILSILSTALVSLVSLPLLIRTDRLDRYRGRSLPETIGVLLATWLFVWGIRNTIWMVRHFKFTLAEFKVRYGAK